MPIIVIGLVGPIASGKGTVIQILKEKGYFSYSTSDVLKEEVKARGLDVNRANCNLVSNDLRGTFGADILARKTAEVIERDNPDLVVIDAIRNPAEINYFKQKFNVKIIGVVADQKRRYEMFVARGLYTDEIKTWEQFKELDDREMQQAGDHKQQVGKTLEMADIVIENNGTLDELKNEVESFLASIGN
jgi:dephospho-CoA kinase